MSSSMNIKSSYTSVTSDVYKNDSKKVHLYFEGTQINRGYTQIGFVEATGNEDASNEMLLAHLQYRAYKQGADAIINLKKLFQNKSTFEVTGKNEFEGYSLPVFTGVAIKYTYDIPSDTLHSQVDRFVALVEQDIEKTKNNEKIQNGAALSLGVIATVALFTLLNNIPDPPKSLKFKH